MSISHLKLRMQNLFFLKNLTEKITVVKIIYYLLLFHFVEFFFSHKFFLECFLVEFPYFLSIMVMKIFLVLNWTRTSLFNSIYFVSWLIHQRFICWTNINVKGNDYCTVYLEDNICKLSGNSFFSCYLIFVDFLSQHFIKILIPTNGKIYLLKILLF